MMLTIISSSGSLVDRPRVHEKIKALGKQGLGMFMVGAHSMHATTIKSWH